MSEVERAIAEYTRERRRQYMKEYMQRPEVKAKNRAYKQRPEVKEKQRVYQQRPEVKEKQRAYQRKYMQRPEVKAKLREKYEAKSRQTKIEKAIALLEAEGYTIIKEDHEHE